MKKVVLGVILCFIFLGFEMVSQSITIGDKLNTYREYFLQEKSYIHFDKPYYTTGENIWFKAYLVDAAIHMPSQISSVLRIELIDEKNERISERVLKVESGGVAGDFYLPDSLSPGNYRVRAYTNWMRNFDEQFYFEKTFEVFKTYVSDPSVATAISDEIEIDVDFFPEGGELVQGLMSMVGFKAIGRDGKGVEVEGEILDDSGNLVTNFRSSHLGMGKFLLNPKPGVKYLAAVKVGDDLLKFSLPVVKQSGCVIRVVNGFSSDNVTIAVSSNGLDITGGSMVFQRRGIFVSSVENKANSSSFAVRLKKSEFPSGICHVTFFDSDQRALAERLIFINYPTEDDLTLEAKKEKYGKRELVELELNLKSFDDSPVLANLSLSITPKEQISYSPHHQNIKNYLLLSSDLQGHIEEPEYYFEKTKDSYQALDGLMLTQGWRRFVWDDVLVDSLDMPKFMLETGITVNGQVVDFYKRDLARSGSVTLSVFGEKFITKIQETDKDGLFSISGNDFIDTTEVILEAVRFTGKKKKPSDDVFINLIEYSGPAIEENVLQPNSGVSSVSDFIEQKKKIEKLDRVFAFDKDAIILDEVEVFGKRELIRDPFEKANSLYGVPGSRIVADSIIGNIASTSPFDLLRRMPSVQVGGTPPNESVSIRGGSNNFRNDRTPLYLLDGIQIQETDVNSLNPRNISYIDVLKGSEAAFFGARGSNGVIAIYSKRGSDVAVTRKPGIVNFTHPGYSRVREFYAPKYNVPKPEHVKPDFRSTLYWEPSVILDENGAATVSFYTSDQLGEFDIKVEGITLKGNPVFKSGTLKVE